MSLKFNTYNIEVKPETRNHRGGFVGNEVYKLIDIDRSGWALICQGNSTCHYVDPDSLQEASHA